MTPISSVITFVGGPLDEHAYSLRSVEGAWKLIELAAITGQRFLFEVSDCDSESQCLGAHCDQKIALFKTDHDGRKIEVALFEPATAMESRYVELIDDRWPLAYYLPFVAFVPLPEALHIFKNLLLEMPINTCEIDQTFNNPAVVQVCTVNSNS